MHHHIVQRRHALRAAPLLAASLCLLTACGGGGTTSATGPVVGTTNISGSVGNASGAPVVDATVSLGTTSGKTDLNGNYTLPVGSSTNTGTVVVVTVAKEGYKSCTGTVDPATLVVAGCTILPLAALDELHPAPADASLVRLGDGEVSGGTTNSKLQITTPLGLAKTISLGWLQNGVNLADYQTLTIHMSMRGLQTSGCADKVKVLQGASPQVATAVKTFSAADNNLANSDLDGALSAYALAVPTSLLNAAGGNVYVTLEAGLCTEGTPADPSDDYEFVGLYGKFS